MKLWTFLLLIIVNIDRCRCADPPCRTNCSNNSTDENCWREALIYRTSDLVEQLFLYSSLAVHVEAFRFHNSEKLNNSNHFIRQSLENHLINQSKEVQLDLEIFNETKERLLNSCQNLTSNPIGTVDEYPPLFCAVSTCASDSLNYTLLFIVSAILTGLIVIICIVQSVQTRRRTTKTVTVLNPDQSLIQSLSTTQTSVNR